MKILVTDNDTTIREGLVKLILKEYPNVDQIREATGVEDGLIKIKQFVPDVLFLDVEMDDGTGFDLLSRLDTIDFHVIFITAFNKYAVDAFKFSAIDFLLKPIDPIDLIHALKKVELSVKQKDLIKQLEILKASLSPAKLSDRKIVLRDAKSLYFVKVDDILHCEAEGSYTTFTLVDGQKIVVSKTLKEYEAMLEPFNFIRTHHAHLVNAQKIIRLDKGEGGSVVLEQGIQIPVSQRKWDQILKILDK